MPIETDSLRRVIDYKQDPLPGSEIDKLSDQLYQLIIDSDMPVFYRQGEILPFMMYGIADTADIQIAVIFEGEDKDYSRPTIQTHIRSYNSKTSELTRARICLGKGTGSVSVDFDSEEISNYIVIQALSQGSSLMVDPGNPKWYTSTFLKQVSSYLDYAKINIKLNNQVRAYFLNDHIPQYTIAV